MKPTASQTLLRVTALGVVVLTLLGNVAHGEAARSPKDLFADYCNGDAPAKQKSLTALTAIGDASIPYLQKILERNQQGRSDNESYRAAADALASIGTDAAADALLAEIPKKKGGVLALPATALASMGAKGVPRLARAAQETRISFSYSPDDPPIHPHREQTAAAMTAQWAIRLVRDRAAAPELGKLLGSNLQDQALEALAAMKVTGFESAARKIWSQTGSRASLRYLLAVDRESMLPFLKSELQALDDEVATLTVHWGRTTITACGHRGYAE